MLKSKRDDQIWCITQPDHAAVSGFLAAHWGNTEFRRPGEFAEATDPERLRAETILGIESHDNGWWEWEAQPELSRTDGLPQDLIELLGDQQEGMNRWRVGIPRLADRHPYASLLTSFHAWWLYAPRCRDNVEPAFSHPLFGPQNTGTLSGEEHAAAISFLQEIEQLQADLTARLQSDASTASWVHPDHLKPHVRLLQLLDSFSLSLCSGIIRSRSGEAPGPGRSEFTLDDVPRSGWNDRVSIDVAPSGPNRVVCRPYPFQLDPLPVDIPAKIFASKSLPAGEFLSFWNAQPLQLVRFELTAGP